jgi:outer membrane PBP1 activator LpoA protein
MSNLTQTLPCLRRCLLMMATAGILLLAGCAGAPTAPPPSAKAEAIDTAAIEQMANEGRFLDAALAYSKLANKVESPQREAFTLQSAHYLLQGNYVPQAYQLLAEIPSEGLPQELRIRKALLLAEIALARQLPDQALETLDQIVDQLGQATDDIRANFHRLRAQAFELVGNHLEMASERVLLEPLLTKPEDILANQRAIMDGLAKLSPEALAAMRGRSEPDILNGWLELSELRHRMESSEQRGADLVLWRERYPDHPALDTILAELEAARPQVLPMPRQIALILPLKNRFAKAAAAIRDGFLAAHYAQLFANTGTDLPSQTVPTLHIYDEGASAELIGLAYEHAVDDGAQFVVGPLDKEAVTTLAKDENLSVPVLALNYSDDLEHLPDNLFQFSLSPEQEARQTAERAWLDGFSRAAVVAPATPWGNRVAKAFTERWLQFGGHVVELQHYDAQKSDYSLPIRRLLNVDESQARAKTLRRIIGKKVEFIPRRRQDIDFIFMAASPRQARLIRPQLKFHHAPDVPVYTTSHAFAGSIDKEADRDMDGVLFADMPWTLGIESPAHTLKDEISQLWPSSAKRYPRLYALGIDAYHVIAQLNSLRQNRTEPFHGETGDLYLDINNRLQRRLLWAKFQGGIPQLLQEF